MAPAATSSPPRRKPRENQYFNLGVRGRKTGLTLPDTGIRDEHGLEPMDHLFSSPEKPKSSRSTRNGIRKNANSTISAEEDMDTGDSTVPDPATVLADRRRASMKMPLPKSKSPMKTYLHSPAKRGPSLGLPSPNRASVAPRSSSVTTSVRRKLDFSGADDDSSAIHGSPSSRKQGLAKLTNGTRLKPPTVADFSDDDAGQGFPDDDNPMDMIGGGDDDVDGLEEEEELVVRDEPEPRPAKKGANKQKAIQDDVESEVPKAKGKRGRPKKQTDHVAEEEAVEEREEEPQAEEGRPAKRSRRSLDAEPEAKGKGKSKITATSSKATKPRKAGRKPGLASIAENAAESPEIERRPPLPGRNRGLFILRRETPSAGSASFQQTRSGRTSIKPLAWWAGERTELESSEIFDGKQKLIVNSIKEVVRADEAEKPQRSFSRARSYRPTKGRSKSKPPKEPESEDEDLEPWELEPGQISGLVREWDPDDPSGRNAEEVDGLIAYSAGAVETRVVATGDFKFAKTLSTPFFGAGFVDLEPGTYKKPKNTRRMHMVFFVVTGRVLAMVNNNSFRIGKGGQWMVPRGNFYSIENVGDKPARIFFCQGNEVAEGSLDMAAAGPSVVMGNQGGRASE